MKIRTVHLPSFLYSRIKDKEEIYSIANNRSAFIENINTALTSIDDIYPDEDVMIIALRQKEGNDFRYAIGCINNKDNDEIINVSVHSFDKFPHIIMSKSYDLLKIFTKFINNIIFS